MGYTGRQLPDARIALRAAPTRRTASPHEMGDYHRDLVLVQRFRNSDQMKPQSAPPSAQSGAKFGEPRRQDGIRRLQRTRPVIRRRPPQALPRF